MRIYADAPIDLYLHPQDAQFTAAVHPGHRVTIRGIGFFEFHDLFGAKPVVQALEEDQALMRTVLERYVVGVDGSSDNVPAYLAKLTTVGAARLFSAIVDNNLGN